MKESARFPGTFTYMTWAVDPRRRGPFVRASAQREKALTQLAEVCDELQMDAGIDHVRLLETTFIAPVADHPTFDIAVLIDGDEDSPDRIRRALREAVQVEPASDLTATNRLRFGDTDASSGPVLLNHFVSDWNREDVISTWQTISAYYGSTLHVTNSTLLTFDQHAPFVAMNYAVVPGPVIRFMLDQLLRPSFAREVTGRLRSVGARPLPVFARRHSVDRGRR